MANTETSRNNEKKAEAGAPAGGAADTAREGAGGLAGTDAVAEAKRQAEEHYDRFVRIAADLENFRKRAARERDEMRQYAVAGLVEALLPILDNLALGLEAARKPGADVEALAGGVEMVLAQFRSTLAGNGVEEINPVGERFDPHRHEAISHQPDPKVPEESVISVVRPGYALNGRLVRPASVVVSSGPAGEGGSG
jgi:molecular chaperone GrpE